MPSRVSYYRVISRAYDIDDFVSPFDDAYVP